MKPSPNHHVKKTKHKKKYKGFGNLGLGISRYLPTIYY